MLKSSFVRKMYKLQRVWYLQIWDIPKLSKFIETTVCLFDQNARENNKLSCIDNT